MQFTFAGRARGEDHADYRFEFYDEENGRIRVETHGLLFEQSLAPWATLRGQAVYDSISGATPTGAPAPGGSGGGGGGGDDGRGERARVRNISRSYHALAGATPTGGGGGSQVPLGNMRDTRYAGSLAADLRLANQTVTPQIAYSTEDDYRSIGLSVSDAIDFNQKNTTLVLGVAHNFDSVQPKSWFAAKDKDSTDMLIGINQLLDRRTVLKLNLTYGFEDGYLSDPYRNVVFNGDPAPGTLYPEKRPGSRTKEIGYLSLTHFFDAVNGAGEFSYRLYHDSYGILSHTVGLQWFQHLGKHIILAPLMRYANQSEASFYGTTFPGNPNVPASLPKNYSADYRLSALSTYTFGLQLTGIITDRLYLDLGYERYEMVGNDQKTAASAYPSANIYTAGFRLRW